MARNKYPELTVQRILNASLRLFIGQGYEKTSIQDITDALGDLTKGAIYHHFKSKEDILLGVVNRMAFELDREWEKIIRSETMSGAEKLTAIFIASVRSPSQVQFMEMAPNMLENPRLLALQIREIVESVAPRYVEPIIKEGVADGSIRTEHPEQFSELILLVTNLWLTPLVFHADWRELSDRVACFDALLAPCGVSLRTNEFMNRIQQLASIYDKRK